MTIRKLKTDELHMLTRLFSYKDVDAMIAENTRNMQKGRMDIFCIFDGDLLMGELHVKYEDEDIRFAKSGERAYFFAFRVHKAHQDQGSGTHLLETVMEKLIRAGYSEFTVGVEDDNARARHMYEKQGFTTPIARIKESYQGDRYEYDLLLKA